MPDDAHHLISELTEQPEPGSDSVSTTGSARLDARTARRVARAGLLGTVVEYYDISLYGLLAVVLAPAFFPSDDPAVSTLAALAVFGTAYVVRPLGGIVFGRLGDRRGRRATLIITILAMCVFSAAIGLLPTYAAIGIAAPLLLVVARLGQGFAAGGEIMGAMTYVLESAPAHRRGRYTGMVPMGSSGGFALAAFVVGCTSALVTPEQLAAWGWRIPFLLSLPLGLLCLWMRLRLEDTPEFTALADRHAISRTPLREALRTSPLGILRVAGYTVAVTGVAYVGMVYVSVLLTTDLGFPKQSVYWMTAIVIGVGALSAPFFGALSDRVGRRPVMIAAAALTAVLAVPIFLALTTTTTIVTAGLVFLVLMLLTQAYSPGYTTFVEIFPARIRYTASSLGYNVGVLVAGFGPYVCAQLVASTGSLVSPSWWAAALGVIGLVAALSFRETRTTGGAHA
jgi:MHS family proline/betaine transporter-like MFS transporter